MADVVVGPLVQNLVSLLQETKFTLIRGVKKDVEKLMRTLSTIQAVLEDAEAKQFKEKSIADWLNKLKDAVYDAEDALDLWLTTTRQRELELTDAGSSKQLPPNLRSLGIHGYSAEEFPARILFQEKGGVRIIQITSCKKLRSLPAEVSDLATLKSLENNSLLDSVVISECENLASVSQGLRYLTSLKHYQIG